MIKKHFAFLLSVVILTLSITPFASAQTSAETEKTRVKVQKLSVDRGKKIEVKLHDKTRYKGYITAVEADSFTVSDLKTSQTQRISFVDVQDVKKSSGGLSTRSWIIIGGATAGALITWAIVKPAFCDGGNDTKGLC